MTPVLSVQLRRAIFSIWNFIPKSTFDFGTRYPIMVQMAPLVVDQSTDPWLLSLPQSDLKRQLKGDLVLVKTSLDVVNNDDAYILANSHRSALITPTKSYSMVMVGTSNALVLVPGQQEPSDEDDPPAKRMKRGQFCRLVQPGGSGAFFIELPPRPLPDPTQVVELLQQTSATMEQLVRHSFQAPRELEQVLDDLPVIETSTNDVIQYRLLSETQQLEAQEAVLGTLLEEDVVHDKNDNLVIISHVMERWPGASSDMARAAVRRVYKDGTWSTEKVGAKVLSGKQSFRNKEIAHLFRHFVYILKNRFRGNPQIAKWSAHNLFLQHPTWESDEALLEAWQARLPDVVIESDLDLSSILRLLDGIAVKDGDHWNYRPSVNPW